MYASPSPKPAHFRSGVEMRKGPEDLDGVEFDQPPSYTASPFPERSPCQPPNRDGLKSLQISLSDAENELGVVGHALGRPGGIPGQLDIHVLDSGDLAGDAVDVLLDHRPRRAAHRREAMNHLYARPLHLDVVQESQLDDVHSELGILYLAQRFEHVFLGRHLARVYRRKG